MTFRFLYPARDADHVRICKLLEGCRLSAYQDPGGVWTIGWGHTATAKKGMRITPSEAERLLRADLDIARAAVRKNVTVKLTAGQEDALTLLVYNIGAHAFAGSTMRSLINQGRLAEADEQFPRWKHAAGKVLPGLVVRRAVERFVWHGEAAVITPPTLKVLRAMVAR